MFHQMQHDVVEKCRDEFVSVIRPDTHSASLISEQRSVEKEELSDRGFLSAMDGSEQARRRRITRGGESFIVFTSRSVLALLHRILPSPSLVVIASASLTDAHQGVTARVGGSSCGVSLRFFSLARRRGRAA